MIKGSSAQVNKEGQQPFLRITFVSPTPGVQADLQFDDGRIVKGLAEGATVRLRNRASTGVETNSAEFRLPRPQARVEVRHTGKEVVLLVDGEVLAATPVTQSHAKAIYYAATGAVLRKIEILEMSSSVSTADALPSTSSPPAPTRAPATPKPASDMEKWLVQVEAQYREPYEREVEKPFESGKAEAKQKYLSALERLLGAASQAARLEDSLALRTERQRIFDDKLPPDDSDNPLPVLKPLRAAYRAQRARLEQDRARGARTHFDRIDKVLTDSQATLTQRQRFDDALLLKTKREELANSWLKPAAAPAPPATTPAPPSGRPQSSPTPAPPAVPSKYSVRDALEWVFASGGQVRVDEQGRILAIKKLEDLPKSRFEVKDVELPPSGISWRTPADPEDFSRLAAFKNLDYLAVRYAKIDDSAFTFIRDLPRLRRVSFDSLLITDLTLETLSGLKTLQSLELANCRNITGRNLPKWKTLKSFGAPMSG